WVIRRNAYPAGKKNFSPYCTWAKESRRRRPTPDVVTATLPGVAPAKSISKYPDRRRKRGPSGQSASTRIDSREACACKRDSLRLPCTTSVYGMDAKLVPTPPPLLVD